MRERIRRYIPSFKQRSLDGRGRGSRATFLDATGEGRDGTPTADERDMETALARVRQLENSRDKGPAAQRNRRRNVVVAKRQESEDGPITLPETIDDIVDGNQPPVGVAGATVTVSIGLSLQVTTISLDGSTFVSISSSWFTFDATGGISSAIPTSTLDMLTTTTATATDTTTTSDSSTPLETSTSSFSEATPSIPTPTSSPITFLTLPTTTSATSAALDQATVSFVDVPTVYSTTLSASMVSSRNMTAHGMVRTTVRKTSTSLKTSSSSRTSSSSHTSSQPTSTRISTSIVAASTIYPAESEPTTPLDSPTTSVETSPDAGVGSNNGSQPLSERLPPILGGVFGGLAGIGLVLWALLFLVRKRRKTSERAIGILGPGTRGGHHRAISTETGAGSVGGMSQARTSLMPGFLGAGLFGRSSADTSAEPAERGFVKISGRKLPSMYGGDDMVPASIAVANARASVSETGSRNVSGGTHHAGGASSSARGSFYQDDDIMHAPTPSPFHPGAARTAMRSGSPAHVSRISEDEPMPAQNRRPPPPPPPQINDPGEGSSRYPTPPPGAVRRMHSLIGTDGVGRSLASQDGSKTSRFTEDV
ncbi:hypothetical protein TWF730_001033 [Orbilia blumenaviensis]|uniref:Uncharacterized protein n=1 Tax=Orbilia blumenaviensis TaxID=1796055 RepID=A0AAV9VNE2_9PEZI